MKYFKVLAKHYALSLRKILTDRLAASDHNQYSESRFLLFEIIVLKN